MARFSFFGEGLPEIDLAELKGKLIVLEGTDGVGRSTHIGLLKQWLENHGHAVLDTGMTRSALAGKRLKQAKEGNTLGGITLSLFYATDFADRLENEIIPALRAGFVVLTDRYIYSLMARAIVRGMDPEWLREVYSFALKAAAIFYLRVNIDVLVTRALPSGGFDYWESGMDLAWAKISMRVLSVIRNGCWPSLIKGSSAMISKLSMHRGPSKRYSKTCAAGSTASSAVTAFRHLTTLHRIAAPALATDASRGRRAASA